MKPTFRALSDAERRAIAAAAFELLEDVGVRLTEPEARALLSGAGARTEDERVHIPARLVEGAIQSAPGNVSIYTRNGELSMRLGGDCAYFGAHTDNSVFI